MLQMVVKKPFVFNFQHILVLEGVIRMNVILVHKKCFLSLVLTLYY